MWEIGLMFVLFGARAVAVVEFAALAAGDVWPRGLRIAGAVCLAALFAPLAPTIPAHAEIAPRLLRELAIGAGLGLLTGLILEAARVAGQLIGVTALAAEDGDEGVPVAATCAAVTVFLALGGHHAWLAAFATSYAVFPAEPAASGALTVAAALGGAVAAGTLFALPVIAVVLLTELVAMFLMAGRAAGAGAARPLVAAAALLLVAGGLAEAFGDFAFGAVETLSGWLSHVR